MDDYGFTVRVNVAGEFVDEVVATANVEGPVVDVGCGEPLPVLGPEQIGAASLQRGCHPAGSTRSGQADRSAESDPAPRGWQRCGVDLPRRPDLRFGPAESATRSVA